MNKLRVVEVRKSSISSIKHSDFFFFLKKVQTLEIASWQKNSDIDRKFHIPESIRTAFIFFLIAYSLPIKFSCMLLPILVQYSFMFLFIYLDCLKGLQILSLLRGNKLHN